MTSLRQIAANHRNAFKSTGRPPRKASGARCNAVRHGLTTETMIGALEEVEDYKDHGRLRRSVGGRPEVGARLAVYCGGCAALPQLKPVFALDSLDRRKLQERAHHFSVVRLRILGYRKQDSRECCGHPWPSEVGGPFPTASDPPGGWTIA
jgi:hypothetical protein